LGTRITFHITDPSDMTRDLQETDHKPTSDKPPEEAKVTTHSNPHSSMCDNMAQTTRRSLETMA